MSAPLDKLGLNQLFPMVKALAKAGADEEFAAWVRSRPGSARLLVNTYLNDATGPVFTVPKLTEQQMRKLFEGVRFEAKILDYIFTRPFMKEIGGRSYRVITCDPRWCDKLSDFFEGYFYALGARGDINLFLVWASITRPSAPGGSCYSTVKHVVGDRSDDDDKMPIFMNAKGEAETLFYTNPENEERPEDNGPQVWTDLEEHVGDVSTKVVAFREVKT